MSDQTEQAIAALAREVESLRRLVTDYADLISRTRVELLQGRLDGVPLQSWLHAPLNSEDALVILKDLAEWVSTVFLRYPDAQKALPACWAWHPEVVEELRWLKAAWESAFDDPTPRSIADWHDRYRPGVVKRISHWNSCMVEDHDQRGPLHARHTEAPLIDALPAIADWWAERREDPGPLPTEAQRREGKAYEEQHRRKTRQR